ncbi:MAG: DUF4403 family protein [Rhizobiales bacterium]|nr:DUF4403 family protein [Hyphomicrobiales bacterium]
MFRIIGGTLIVVLSFTVTLFALDWFSPRAPSTALPPLAAVAPLPPVTRTSQIIAPTAIALSAIRDTMERLAPRDLTGKPSNPVSQLLSKAEIGMSVTRGPMAVTGRSETMTIATAITGSLRVTGQIATQAGNVGGAITGLLSQDLGRGVQSITGKVLDQRADIRGNITVNARPTIVSTWRLDPHLSAQVTVGDTALSIAGVKLNVANEAKPLLDKTVNDQVSALDGRLRNDPFLEQIARREWAKMCRAISLGAAGTGMPKLWLEIKPTRAFAAQPRIDASAMTLTVGVQAETRVVPAETKPNCPFPAKLELVAPMDQGRVAIGLPIDIPFTELNRLLEAQLKGKNFPEDGSGPVAVTVQGATIAASGDRLLISLRVKAREQKSWFGFGAEAMVHVWGRPALDREQQMMRLDDVSLAVESQAALGLLGAAAQAAIPYLQKALARNAVIDLKPFAANARKSIEAAIGDFRQQQDGVRVDAAVTALRLSDIAFDAKTLRVTAEADGNVRVAVTKLPAQ